MEPSLRLVVGLGNPAPSYRDTRHNVGRDFIEHIAQETKSSFVKNRQAEILRLPAFFGIPLEAPLLIAKLSCFMNESGPAIQKILQDENIKPDQMLVVLDDFMIPFGSLRLRLKGSSGGHNGLNSMIDALGNDEFPRLRVGIGPVPNGEDPAHFVLEPFSKDELTRRPTLFETLKEGISFLLMNGWQKAMTGMNKAHL